MKYSIFEQTILQDQCFHFLIVVQEVFEKKGLTRKKLEEK